MSDRAKAASAFEVICWAAGSVLLLWAIVTLADGARYQYSQNERLEQQLAVKYVVPLMVWCFALAILSGVSRSRA